jgi:amino-acid racemase
VKTIGMVGGLGPESSALYYRVMNRAVRERLGGRHSARVLLDSVDFHEFADMQERGDWDAVARLLAASVRRLEGAGAEVLLIACNTAHRAFDTTLRAASRPLLHVADAAGTALRAGDRKRVALLGTRYTMQGGFIAARLAQRHGIEAIVPDAAEQERLHAIIQDELVAGAIHPASRAFVAELGARCAVRGADALLLACTELGLLFPELDAIGGTAAELALPIYDTARLHALAAVDLALA